MPNDIFVICEQRDSIVSQVSYQLLGEADKLAQITKKRVCAVILGCGIKKEAEKLIGYGADIVYVVDDENLKHYLTEQYSQAAYQIIKEFRLCLKRGLPPTAQNLRRTKAACCI
jgi:electron transfer flavoprotein alpha subunit